MPRARMELPPVEVMAEMLEGLTLWELAVQLGCSTQTIKGRFREADRALGPASDPPDIDDDQVDRQHRAAHHNDRGLPAVDLSWQVDAECNQTDPEAFFPEKGGSTREAKRICRTCIVRAECLDYALTVGERFGIWGGMSERQRRRLTRQPTRDTGVCGTHNGYERHQYRNELACDECHEARREHQAHRQRPPQETVTEESA